MINFMWYLQVKYLKKKLTALQYASQSVFETYMEGKVAQLTPEDVVIQCFTLSYINLR